MGKLPSCDMLVTCILRILCVFLRFFGQRICLPYRFCEVNIPAQDKTVRMLYGLGNSSPISRSVLHGARNGPIRPIGPNIFDVSVTDPYGTRKTIQVPSIGKTGTKTMSESCLCPTFSHELQNVSKACA